LQECRIYSRERTHPLRRESCGKGHTMLFGDPDIKCAIRMGLRKFVYAGARWHSSGNRTDARISVGQLGERFAKNILVSRWSAARSLVLFARNDIEFGDAVIFIGSFFGKLI